jgi:hypothetical protein
LTNLANPGAFITFGIQPQANLTNGSLPRAAALGESVLVSQISVTGVDPLSSTISTTDNFLNDSAMDTNTWAVNALFPASILLVPTNAAYSVGWTLPAAQFSLEVNSVLSGPSLWSVPSTLASVTLFPGKTTLIPKSSLPPGNTAFFRLAKLTPTKLQVLLPGETNAPGTVSGKTGTPTPVSLGAGGLETVTINCVDANFNIVSVSDGIVLSTTDGSAITPVGGNLVAGTLQQTVAFGSQGTFTVTATDTTNPSTIAAGTSSSVTVGP